MTVPKRSWFQRLRRSRGNSKSDREEKMSILEGSDAESELEMEVASTSEELPITSSPATATHAQAVPCPSPPRQQLWRERTPPRIYGDSPYRSCPSQATRAHSSAVAEPAEPIRRTLSARSSLSHLKDMIRGHRPFRSAKVRAPQGIFTASSPSSVPPPPPPPPPAMPEPVPPRSQEDRDLDRLLEEVWSAGEFHGQRKLREELLKKLAEISQREKTYVSELLSFDDATPLLAANEMERVLHTGSWEERNRAMHSGKTKFDRMRLNAKEEVLRRANALQNKRYSSSCYWRRSSTHKTSCPPIGATQILRSWFEEHQESDDPYPSYEEARALARECGITVEQVWEWIIGQWHTNESGRVAGRMRKSMTSSVSH